MGKAHIISRVGSKTNDIKYFKDLLPMDVKIVVEPYGGSFAVIRDVYGDKKYKKYVNDLDDELYYVYENPDELIEGYKKWNIINGIENLYTKDKLIKFNKLKLNESIKNYITQNVTVKGTITNSKNVNDTEEDLKLMKQIEFSNEDAFIVIEKFRKNKNAFIFLDPPYLFSNNASYLPQKENEDMTDWYMKYLDILNDKTTKAKIMLVINNLAILRILFKDFVKKQYDKIYQFGKRKSSHLIITNY